MNYGSIAQTQRRRRKNGGMDLSVTCECKIGPFCPHHDEWRERNIRLLRIRSPHDHLVPKREIVERVADRP